MKYKYSNNVVTPPVVRLSCPEQHGDGLASDGQYHTSHSQIFNICLYLNYDILIIHYPNYYFSRNYEKTRYIIRKSFIEVYMIAFWFFTIQMKLVSTWSTFTVVQRMMSNDVRELHDDDDDRAEQKSQLL